MPIDLTKLTPAPWWSERRYSHECEVVPRIKCAPDPETRECGWIADLIGAPYLGYASTLANAEFIALARNAFDVLLRRGWGVGHSDGDGPLQGWFVMLPPKWWPLDRKLYPLTDARYPDPFTALVEADAWYKQNVEAAPEAK